MQYTILLARLLLAAIFIVFSLNFWWRFIPVPPPPEGLAANFLGALFLSGYLAAVKVLELLGGLLVLSGRYTGAGLLILGPIILNILSYDLFLAKTFNPVSSFAGVLALFLLWSERARFAPLVKA